MKKENLYKASDDSKKTIFDKIQNYTEHKYNIQFNTIAQDFEIAFKESQKFESLNIFSLLIELNKSEIDCSIGKIEIFLKSELVKKFNPIAQYFNSLNQWDGKDYIQELCSYVPTYNDDEFVYHFKKWLVRTVKCALEDGYFNKQAFILVHKGQSSGKSTFCRFLCPPALSNYIAEDISNDKDARILLCKNFLINLDELAVLNKKEVNMLKSFMTKTVINERLPYDKKNSILPRVCSFIGSTNMSTFLNDETGSVRWLCFELKEKIDFNYSKDIDINKVWAQAYALAYNGNIAFDCELTNEDILANEKRNQKFSRLTLEQELVSKYYEKSNNKEDFKTCGDIEIALSHLNVKINSVNIGRALSGFGFARVKSTKRQVYGYLAKSNFKNSPWEIETKT